MPLNNDVKSVLYKRLNRYKVTAVTFLPASIFCRCRHEGYPFSSACSSVQPLSLRISRNRSPRRFKKIFSCDFAFIEFKNNLIHPISSTSDSMYLIGR